jgi:hypothetical protein
LDVTEKNGFVMPAQAGIQGCGVRTLKHWIPAFAGMTTF